MNNESKNIIEEESKNNQDTTELFYNKYTEEDLEGFDEYCKNCIRVLNLYRDAILETDLFGKVLPVYDSSDANYYDAPSATGWSIEVFAGRHSENKLFFTDDVLELNFGIDFYKPKMAKMFYKKLKKVINEDFKENVIIELSYCEVNFALKIDKIFAKKKKYIHYQKMLHIAEKTDDKKVFNKIVKIFVPKFKLIYNRYLKTIVDTLFEFESDLILQGLIDGLPYDEIQDKYGITLCTNDPRVISLYEKYNVNNRAELYKILVADKSKNKTVIKHENKDQLSLF